jgi:ribosomal protein S12 methylthiotransferase
VNRKKKTINIVTLGCSKNLVDSEELSGQLRANNIEVLHDQNTLADVVIINTCGFIFDAKQESVDTILQFANEKKKGNLEKLIVMGCLSQRYKTDLLEEIPEVDAFYGVDQLADIVSDLGNKYYPLLSRTRDVTTGHFAYLKIAEGCNRQCSFCAIPLIRGKHISRDRDEVLHDARQLAEDGVKEIILISQDLTYYGMERGGSAMLPGLVESIAAIEGLEWIRLHYAYPANFPLDLIDVVASRDNVCKYLDIPFQHISDNILRSMRRGVNKKQTYQLIEELRQKIPGLALRTSLMVGYPGETEEQFRELEDFVREIKFDRLGVFTYSHEEDTHAYKMKDDIPQKVKAQRVQQLMDVQAGISLEKNREKLNKVFKVIIDREAEDHYVGRTEFDSPEVDNEVIIAKTVPSLKPGSFRFVRILEADTHDLNGTIVDQMSH